MGKYYETKYECPVCYAYCDTYSEAQNHCPTGEIDEVYQCEACGIFYSDPGEAEYCHGEEEVVEN